MKAPTYSRVNPTGIPYRGDRNDFYRDLRKCAYRLGKRIADERNERLTVAFGDNLAGDVARMES